MTGWRAYTLGAFTGIVAWCVLSGLAVWVMDGRRGERRPLVAYLEEPLMGIMVGAGLAFFVGFALAAVD
jgi:hypothetical protein